MSGLKDFPKFGALAGLKILDSGSNIAGPFAGGLLAECGATVIHFEAPKKPDNQRGWYGYPQNHRNQLSMVADLKTKEGREIFLKLIKWADIWVESSRGGQYDRLNLSDDYLWTINPKLAICHVSGYGQSGVPEYVTKASYDAAGQAFSGYMSLNGTDHALKINPYLSDYVCGLTTCWSMLACYVSTQLTGKGESVDVAQYEALARITDGRFMQYATDGIKMPRTGNKDAQAALFSFYTCKDGGVIIDVSACTDGHGGEDFYQTLKNATNLQQAMDEILSRKRSETVFDQWESQILLRMLLKYTIIMVTKAPQQMIEDMHIKYAKNIDEAFVMARDVLKAKGINHPNVTIIPDGVSVIVK